ncbi:hypothetical protein [Microtetraspora sp. NBRC 16547]|uniref:hypothetical protein n=1 Tax=Microtetraspora sp. NBRC 16547 TaxID=3030993 RepID=UPI0024A2CDF8|nr:hypothetical protein [Microtetraspora sp. NBRC 16547]GLX00620.1 hypothetical protein Misp02_47060 [Microtetraspora sp. NBRC 16547]
MELLGPLGRKIALVGAGAGVLATAAVALGGIASADRSSGSTGLRGSEVTVVKETRKVPGRGILSTNVVCGEGRRAVGGGQAFNGAHDPRKPVAFPVSAPGSTSDAPGSVQDAWDFVVVNPMKQKISVEVYAICVPLG